MPKVTYRQQMRTAKGKQYGPYWYAEWKERGKVKTRYVGKELPEHLAGEARKPAGPGLFDAEFRLRECWLLLGYDPTTPPTKRDPVRKKVWNLLHAATRPAAAKAELEAAWLHIDAAIWPTAKRGAKQEGNR